MLSKLRLNLTEKFGVIFATKLVAKMVTSFLKGPCEYKALGSEQGGITHWDDFVLEHTGGRLTHFQIKRQYTSFDDIHTAERGFDGTVPKGTPTPFDACIKSLGEWIINTTDPDERERRDFQVILPSMDIQIKKDLPLRHFYNLVRNHITPTSTAAKLSELFTTDGPSKLVYSWLKSWCGFTDAQHVLDACQRLSIQITGSEENIEEMTDILLQDAFANVKDTKDKIVAFMAANSSFTSSLTPRALLCQLYGKLKPDFISWSEYKLQTNNWSVTGIHDYASSSELAPAIVKSLWEPDKKGCLFFNAPVQSKNTAIARAVVRLALHFRQTSTAHVHGAGEWKEIAKLQTGETLGITDSDFDSLGFVDTSVNYDSLEARILSSAADQDNEAKVLTDHMHTITWDLVCNKVNEKIWSKTTGELRDAVDKRWRKWQTLITDIEEQKQICRSMLHPKAEGEQIVADMRVGTKTASLIADGLLLLLVVSVALYDSDEDWKTIGQQLTVQTRALAYWSGSASGERRVRKLSEPGIVDLLGQETCKVLILPQVDSTRFELEGGTLAGKSVAPPTLMTAHRPALLVTNSTVFATKMQAGNINEIATFLKEQMNTIN